MEATTGDSREPVVIDENIDLLTLVDHRESVQGLDKVGDVYQTFSKHGHEYVAVVDGQRLLGICSRGQVGYLLGSRYGFPIFSQRPIRDHLLEHHLSIKRGTAVMTVLDQALSRPGFHFFDEVALVDDENRFLGMISVQSLIRLQSGLLSEKVKLAEAQRRELLEKNQELFRGVNELRQSQARYASLFENNAMAVALLNRRGDIETCNARLRSLLALEGSAPARNLVDLIAPDERQTFLRLIQHTDDGEETACSQAREFHLLLGGRGSRLFKFFCGWIRETGQICVCLDDVTDARTLERRVAQKEKSALLESLVGGIAHEINNKLMPILGYAQIMAKELHKKELKRLAEFADTIKVSASESATIIRQLLQLSRPTNSELQHCDLRDIVTEAVSLLSFRIKEANVDCRLELPEKEIHLLADPGQLKQVVFNMAVNALHAMEKSPLRVLTLNAGACGEHAILTIADTGHGIRPEHINRIFDPFFTTKSPDRGTGLGLSVCFSIIKQHSGDISVESTPGNGAVFRITLPVARSREKSPDPSRENPTAEMLRAHILVVDDEPFVTGLIQEMLRQSGCRVEWVSNGQQAVGRLKDTQYDLIISDVRMPEMNGMQLLEWIKNSKPELASRFIFITGDAGSDDMNQLLSNLGAPVLHKPFTEESLLAQCRSLLLQHSEHPVRPSRDRVEEAASQLVA